MRTNWSFDSEPASAPARRQGKSCKRPVDQIPEAVLGDRTRRLDVSADDLHELNEVVIELARQLLAVTRGWVARQGLDGGETTETDRWE